VGDKILQFGTAKAGPGERGTGFVKAGELSDGSSVDIPVVILNGSNLGPRLMIIGGEDGDEYPGPLGAMDAANNVLPKMLKEMSGSAVFLPIVNITAFRGNPYGGGMRNSPLDLDQGLRLPRLYPGLSNGRHSEQLAFQISYVQKQYDPDIFVRLHGCRQIYGWDRVLFRKPTPGSKLDNLARACVTRPGTMVLLTTDNPAIVGKKGEEERPIEISLETNGGDDGVGNGMNGDAMRDGIVNMMRHLDMIPGNEIKVGKIQYVSSKPSVYSAKGGFFKSLVKVKDEVRQGQTIGEIRNFFGEVSEEIRAPFDGVVLGYWCAAPHVGAGQWRIFEIAGRSDYR